MPQLIANIASYDGGDPSFLRAQNLDENGVTVKIQEDKSRDNEISHTPETINIFTLEGQGQLTGVQTDQFDVW